MEVKLLMLALDRLSDEHEKLKAEVRQIREELTALRKEPKQIESVKPAFQDRDDELINLKDVQAMLGICYNSLKKLIGSGKIKPIRINDRRVRFSKRSIQQYIQLQFDQS